VQNLGSIVEHIARANAVTELAVLLSRLELLDDARSELLDDTPEAEKLTDESVKPIFRTNSHEQ
jgi:hypothetical protein